VLRLFFLAIHAILLVGLVQLGLSGTDISIADTGIPDDEVTSSVSKAGNSSARATVTITMYDVADE
jgi:hypothetical protein